MSCKRVFDMLCACIAVAVLLIPVLIVCAMVKLTSKGPVFHVSERIGQGNRTFGMYKFRTMMVDTPSLATHLLVDAERYLTPVGSFLRQTSLDEIPQLINIIQGTMSFVGPRPALYNQLDLIELRTAAGIQELVPGLTGWAQVNGRDELSVPEKVQYDSYYMNHRSFLFDLKVMAVTLINIISTEGVSH